MTNLLYLFNPDQDLALASGEVNYMPPASARRMAEELALLPVWFADGPCSVLAPSAYNQSFLEEMLDLFPLPASLRTQAEDFTEVRSVVPWGRNPALRKRLLSLGVPDAALPSMEDIGRLRDLSHRLQAVQLLPGLQVDEVFCGESCYLTALSDCRAFVESLERCLLKAPLSGSGKGLNWCKGAFTPLIERWCARVLEQQGGVVGEPVYNKVEIPRGGEYALVLSDGTKVHLNSMSSLRFPVAFTTGKREVELQGEAYFEVSKTGQPFIVNANGMQVEVLGTTFNISAYPDEEYQTTLVNGSVKVSAEKGESLILKPSQQATIALGSNSIQVRTVDTSFYTSWVKGKINFKDQRLEDIMKTLSRWYDMNVVYENEKLKNIRFGCNLNRYEEITPFVKLLEKTEEVHVKIEGNTITFHN